WKRPMDISAPGYFPSSLRRLRGRSTALSCAVCAMLAAGSLSPRTLHAQADSLSASSARIEEFQLASRYGLLAGQWITVVVTAAGESIDTSVVIRAFDRDGALVGSIQPVLASTRGSYSPFSRMLIGTPFWEGNEVFDGTLLVFPLADARLSFAMDT